MPRATRRSPALDFDPERHRDALCAAIRAIEAAEVEAPLSPPALHAILRRYPRDGSGFFSRSELIAGSIVYLINDPHSTCTQPSNHSEAPCAGKVLLGSYR